MNTPKPCHMHYNLPSTGKCTQEATREIVYQNGEQREIQRYCEDHFQHMKASPGAFKDGATVSTMDSSGEWSAPQPLIP